MSLDAAISVLNLRLDNLKEKTGSVTKNEATEIKALLPEVKAKLADLKNMKVETDRKTAELYQIAGKLMVVTVVCTSIKRFRQEN